LEVSLIFAPIDFLRLIPNFYELTAVGGVSKSVDSFIGVLMLLGVFAPFLLYGPELR